MAGEEWARTMGRIAQQEYAADIAAKDRDAPIVGARLEALAAAARTKAGGEVIKRSSPAGPMGDVAQQQQGRIQQPAPEYPEWSRMVWCNGWLMQAATVIAVLQEQLPGWRIEVVPTGSRRKNGNGNNGG